MKLEEAKQILNRYGYRLLDEMTISSNRMFNFETYIIKSEFGTYKGIYYDKMLLINSENSIDLTNSNTIDVNCISRDFNKNLTLEYIDTFDISQLNEKYKVNFNKYIHADAIDVFNVHLQNEEEKKENTQFLDLEQLQTAIDKANLPWQVQEEYCTNDIVFLVAHSKNYYDPVNWNNFYKDITYSTEGEGIVRNFQKICMDLHEKLGVYLKIWPSTPEVSDDELDIRLNLNKIVNDKNSTHKNIIDRLVDIMKKVDSYFKNIAPTISR